MLASRGSETCEWHGSQKKTAANKESYLGRGLPTSSAKVALVLTSITMTKHPPPVSESRVLRHYAL